MAGVGWEFYRVDLLCMPSFAFAALGSASCSRFAIWRVPQQSQSNNPQIALLARCLNPLVLLSKAVVGWLLRGGFGAQRRAAQVLKLGI